MPVYTYNARAKALHHIRVSKETHPKLNLSERIVLASKATNVPEKTLRRWVIEEVMHPNLTRKDFEERLRKRGRKRLVDPDVEVEIVEWVRRRHAAGYVTSALDIQNHADNMHNLILSPSYISVMMNRNGYVNITSFYSLRNNLHLVTALLLSPLKRGQSRERAPPMMTR